MLQTFDRGQLQRSFRHPYGRLAGGMEEVLPLHADPRVGIKRRIKLSVGGGALHAGRDMAAGFINDLQMYRDHRRLPSLRMYRDPRFPPP